MTPLKRVVDFVMDKGGSGEESLRDTNRRLQNVVEEMLTKNMYLQQVRMRFLSFIRVELYLVK